MVAASAAVGVVLDDLDSEGRGVVARRLALLGRDLLPIELHEPREPPEQKDRFVTALPGSREAMTKTPVPTF